MQKECPSINIWQYVIYSYFLAAPVLESSYLADVPCIVL